MSNSSTFRKAVFWKPQVWMCDLVVLISGIFVSEFSPLLQPAMGLPRSFMSDLGFTRAGPFEACDLCFKSELGLPVQSKNAIKGAKNGINVFSQVRYEGAKRSDCIIPGPSWRDILITSGHVGCVLSLYGALRQKFACKGYWLDCPIAVSARKLIMQIRSFGANGPSQLLVEFYNGSILDVVSKAIECGKSESEMLDGCRALSAIASIVTPLVFDRLLKSISQDPEQLRAKIEDLNSKVSFLRFWTPFDDYHHRSTPCFSNIVLVASDDDSGKPASNPIPVSAHKAVLLDWIPELILSSDAVRTKETLKTMQEQVRGFLEAEVHFISSFYSIAAMDGQTAEHLQRAICKFSMDEILTVMCMGHNRGWEEAASMFSGTSIEMKTYNAALLEATGKSWEEV
ncbi:Uncharacterized protein LOK49_LG10G01437 [Camellia lanceoleosa]|uniref:Uncharacterized protein n=1 Tax=Camellia lanceoleosa TaxID=1840588 RepID=A0ACC0GAQ1_9ERIC|nr:Uncharacterized protein LOK49_LG10G01437 [Camellia lanceoleosa]